MNSASSLTALASHLDLWPDDDISTTVSVPINRMKRGSFDENQALLSHLGSQSLPRADVSVRDRSAIVGILASPMIRTGRRL